MLRPGPLSVSDSPGRMASGTVKAKWVGTYEAELPDGTQLVPGETVVDLPRDEAEGSDNWQVASGSSKKGDD